MRRRAGDAAPLPTFWLAVAIAGLFASSAALQAMRDRADEKPGADASFLYVPSGRTLQRVTLSYDALAADVYWIRAIQHYGGTKLSKEAGKRYALLYPFLDIATTLDPRFTIAYRFGAIFLAEAYPNGLGRPDLAVALLEKGLREQPEKWQYLHDIGFVYYWWLHDYNAAAEWFRRAGEIPGSPWWLRSLAAATLAEGGDRQASRFLWQNIEQTAENDWLRNEAGKRLLQLEALDRIDQLRVAVQEFARRTGRTPDGWEALVRAGTLRGVPVDPTGSPYVLDGSSLGVTVSSDSKLFPLPTEPSRKSGIGIRAQERQNLGTVEP